MVSSVFTNAIKKQMPPMPNHKKNISVRTFTVAFKVKRHYLGFDNHSGSFCHGFVISLFSQAPQKKVRVGWMTIYPFVAFKNIAAVLMIWARKFLICVFRAVGLI